MKINIESSILRKSSFFREDKIPSGTVLIETSADIKINNEENIANVVLNLEAKLENSTVFTASLDYYIMFKLEYLKDSKFKENIEIKSKKIFEEAYKKEISKYIKTLFSVAGLSNIQIPTF